MKSDLLWKQGRVSVWFGLVLSCGATIFGGMYVRIGLVFLVGFWKEDR